MEFEQSAPVTLEVEFAEEPPARLEVRPSSLGLKPERTSPHTVRLRLTKPAKFTLAPSDGHHALHVFADEPLNYSVQPDDLYFGPGEHDARMRDQIGRYAPTPYDSNVMRFSPSCKSDGGKGNGILVFL